MNRWPTLMCRDGAWGIQKRGELGRSLTESRVRVCGPLFSLGFLFPAEDGTKEMRNECRGMI